MAGLAQGRREPRPVRLPLANTHASWWRRRWRGEQPTDSLPEPAVGDSADLLGSRDAVRQALACLPPKQRAVIVLRYFADLGDAQIAEILGCSVATVRSQASRALARLRVDSAARSLMSLES
ncbi:sigma-70 family RNA polymerase sigma factor [Microbispora catharanthi]|uniref:sigma-70 family RNA polymerase sigma factor n=1 Tax=Microbispora catharanthi TaxID=1712871 RepID=UPI001F118207|nr:sigma-70 family RNA polymerase sigma factor [Microbispora catharanthi]